MILKKKAIISVFEMSLTFLMFVGALSYLGFHSYSTTGSNHPSIDSALDLIYISDNFSKIILDESLTSSSRTENWAQIETYLNNSFLNYDLSISNTTQSKKIFECTTNKNKRFAQRIIAIHNLTTYEFRTVTLGVCY